MAFFHPADAHKAAEPIFVGMSERETSEVQKILCFERVQPEKAAKACQQNETAGRKYIRKKYLNNILRESTHTRMTRKGRII